VALLAYEASTTFLRAAATGPTCAAIASAAFTAVVRCTSADVAAAAESLHDWNICTSSATG
jgi:hypothetical protein